MKFEIHGNTTDESISHDVRTVRELSIRPVDISSYMCVVIRSWLHRVPKWTGISLFVMTASRGLLHHPIRWSFSLTLCTTLNEMADTYPTRLNGSVLRVGFSFVRDGSESSVFIGIDDGSFCMFLLLAIHNLLRGVGGARTKICTFNLVRKQSVHVCILKVSVYREFRVCLYKLHPSTSERVIEKGCQHPSVLLG
jgi:hypothetical protein